MANTTSTEHFAPHYDQFRLRADPAPPPEGEDEWFQPGDRNQARAALGLAPDRPLLVYVGRLDREKNLGFLLEAFAAVLRVHPDVAKVLKASNNHFLEEIEEILGRPVLVTGDPTLHTEKFDLA